MDSFVALLGSVWYLVLVAAISPVMILNANAAVHGQKQNTVGLLSLGQVWCLAPSASRVSACWEALPPTSPLVSWPHVPSTVYWAFYSSYSAAIWRGRNGYPTASKNLESRKLLGRGPLVPTACSPGGLSEWLRISLPFRYSSRRVSASGLPICHSSSEF